MATSDSTTDVSTALAVETGMKWMEGGPRLPAGVIGDMSEAQKGKS